MELAEGRQGSLLQEVGWTTKVLHPGAEGVLGASHRGQKVRAEQVTKGSVCRDRTPFLSQGGEPKGFKC